jgi:hypothetical protein
MRRGDGLTHSIASAPVGGHADSKRIPGHDVKAFGLVRPPTRPNNANQRSSARDITTR